MKFLLGSLLLTFFLLPQPTLAGQSATFFIQKVNPFIFGKGTSSDQSYVVGDLGGKFLGQVLISDVRGRLNFRISVCNKSQLPGIVAISAAIADVSGEVLWSVKDTEFDVPGGNYQKFIGFNVYRPGNYDAGLVISELKLPIKLSIAFTEKP